mgnify:CR=1 FL=1
MIIKAILFVFGNLGLYLLDVLPAVSSVILLALTLPALAGHPRLRPVAVCAAGFVWSSLHGQWLHEQAIPAQFLGRTVLVEGVVINRPDRRDTRRLRFQLHASRLHDGTDWHPVNTRVRLDWYDTQVIPAGGERWQLAVRLKPPGGFANPGGFDYERWLYQQRIRATGYVRSDPRNRRTGAGLPTRLQVLRNRVADALEQRIETTPAMALVGALTIGVREPITARQWEVLRATGTTHLMAISGLHISLVAGLLFMGVKHGWSGMARLTAYLPATRVAAVVALLGSLLYALLSGFAVPAQRAMIMVAVLMAAVMCGRRTTFPAVIGIAGIATLLLEPLSILATGWWLSFWAVTVFAWFVTGRVGGDRKLHRWFVMPAVLVFCMMPVLLLFFQQVSLVAPLANIVAVPWVSFLVVPVALAGTALYSLSEVWGLAMMQLSAWLLRPLWEVLTWLASSDVALRGWPQPSLPVLVLSTAGVALLCVPRGVPGRWAGALLLLPLLFGSRPQPGHGEAWITLLDVGQGLATVVRTAGHTLVYDTGPAFGPDFDTGRAVVSPYLRYAGIRHIDRLVVSHGDNDHIGGAASLLRDYPHTDVLTSVPAAFSDRAVQTCRQGMRWTWDGVGFEILHPAPAALHSGNDASCVLRVTLADGQRLLLPGDIEAAAERDLLERHGGDLSADVLVVPHHGSRTSSTAAFVSAVNPAVALIPAGYLNRYRFPHPDVVARYTAIGSEVHQTGYTGAITVRVVPGADCPRIERYRRDSPRLWRRAEQPSRFGY